MSRVTDAIEKGRHLKLYKYMVDNACTVQKAAKSYKTGLIMLHNCELMQLVDAAMLHYRLEPKVEYELEVATKQERFTDLLSGEGDTVGSMMGKDIKWRSTNDYKYW